MGNCFGLFRRSNPLLDDNDDTDYQDFVSQSRLEEPVFHIHPGVKKYLSELTDDEQMLIFSRIATIEQIQSHEFKSKRYEPVEDCIICLEPYVENELVKTLQCEHSFHSECIDKWLMLASQCPKCMHDVKDLPFIPSTIESSSYLNATCMKGQSSSYQNLEQESFLNTRRNNPSCSSDINADLDAPMSSTSITYENC